jgi:hypothetical protein
MPTFAKIIPVTNPTKPMYGAAILNDDSGQIEVLACKYDFDTKRKAIKWVNKNLYRLRNAIDKPQKHLDNTDSDSN